MNHKFVVGQKFDSYTSLEEKVEDFKKHEFVDLYRRDTRSLENAIKRKRISKEKAKNHDLVFYEIKYQCLHGGGFHSKSTGKRKTSLVYNT